MSIFKKWKRKSMTTLKVLIKPLAFKRASPQDSIAVVASSMRHCPTGIAPLNII